MKAVQSQIQTVGKNLQTVGAGLTLGLTTPLLGFAGVAIKAAADLDTLKSSLDSAFQGDIAGSNEAFKAIKEFASGTAFDLEEVTKSFIKLKNQGLNPSIESLKAYGNIAAATGNSLNQVTEAVADAAVGEFERLKEFGIKAKSEGDNVSFTFQGVTTKLKKNSGQIQKYLQDIGNVNFAGAIDRQADTFQGKMDSIRKNLASTFASLGGILIEYIEPFANYLKTLSERFKNLSPTTQKWIVILGAVAAAAGPLLLVTGTLIRNITTIIPLIRAMTVALAANPFGAVAVAVTALAGGLLLANSRMTALTDSQKEMNSLTAAATQNIAAEKAQLEKYLSVAKNDKLSKEERQRAIENLNKLSPKYLKDLTLETINTDDATTATKNYVNALLQKAKVIAAEDKLVDVQKQILDLQLGVSDVVKPSVGENLLNLAKSFGDVGAMAVKTAGTVAENFDKESTELAKLEKQLLSFIQTTKIDPTAFISDDTDDTEAPVVPPLKKPEFKLTAEDILDLGELENDMESLRKLDDTLNNTSQNFANAAEAASENNFMSVLGASFEEFSLATEEAVTDYEEKMAYLEQLGQAVGAAVASAFEQLAGTILSSLGLANNGIQGFVKGLAETAIKLISMLLAECIALAIKNASISAAFTGPGAVFAQPAFIATAVGGVLAAFAAIPKFATGGIVDGSSFYGDKILARVNSGELILNQKQQKSLYGMIQPAGEPIIMTTSTRLSGSDILIVTERANKKNNRRS